MTSHVFFHRDMDGLCCAYLLWLQRKITPIVWQNQLYKSVQYKERVGLSQVKAGDTVFFVDFTPQVDIVTELQEIGCRLLSIFDHHPVKELESEIKALSNGSLMEFFIRIDTEAKGGVAVVNKHIGGTLPVLVKHVGLRDVWDFSSSDTRTVCAGIDWLCPYPESDEHLEDWFRAFHKLSLSKVLEAGELAVRKLDAEIVRAAAKATKWIFVLGDNSETIEMLGVFEGQNISEVGTYLAKRSEDQVAFVAVIVQGQLRISFRSLNGTARSFALRFGGGGHPNAASASTNHYQIEKTPSNKKIIHFIVPKEKSYE
jgi:oligoribonuclease NrnB/cAMP/cGMP phosphodiesterase (DHH superfamily)